MPHIWLKYTVPLSLLYCAVHSQEEKSIKHELWPCVPCVLFILCLLVHVSLACSISFSLCPLSLEVIPFGCSVQPWLLAAGICLLCLHVWDNRKKHFQILTFLGGFVPACMFFNPFLVKLHWFWWSHNCRVATGWPYSAIPSSCFREWAALTQASAWEQTLCNLKVCFAVIS